MAGMLAVSCEPRALETSDVIEQTAEGWQLVNPFFGPRLREWPSRP